MDKKFSSAIQKIKSLEQYPDYESALIFGSIASGSFTKESDIDIVVVTKENREFKILHPYINGIKLDLSYRSYSQLSQEMYDQVKKGSRAPMIAGSKILFDKTTRLKKLVKELNEIKPAELTKKDCDDIQFLVYHCNNKIERNINNSPTTSLLTMHTSIQEILAAHYKINRHWLVSSKKMIEDLNSWDQPLLELLTNFLNTSEVVQKIQQWNAIVEHVLSPLGGIKPLNEHIPNEYITDVQRLL